MSLVESFGDISHFKSIGAAFALEPIISRRDGNEKQLSCKFTPIERRHDASVEPPVCAR